MALSKCLGPKNYVAFRKIFGFHKHKDIPIHFINDILERKGRKQIQDVEFLSPIQDQEISSRNESIVGVLYQDSSGWQIIVEYR